MRILRCSLLNRLDTLLCDSVNCFSSPWLFALMGTDIGLDSDEELEAADDKEKIDQMECVGMMQEVIAIGAMCC